MDVKSWDKGMKRVDALIALAKKVMLSKGDG